MTDEELKDAAEATAHDHLRSMLSLMARGARINLSDIPDDPTFLSSNISGEMAQELAALISVQFGRGYMAALDDVESDAKAALPSGVRVDALLDEIYHDPDYVGGGQPERDDEGLLCPFSPYDRGRYDARKIVRKALSAIEPTQAPEGEIERHQLFGDFGVEYDDDHYVIRWLNDDGSMDSLSVFHSGSIVGVRTGADGEQLSRKFHFDDAVHASPSHAETVAPYAAALRMIRDAVGELFGPVSDLESEEAVLLRGPEPHHEAEAIIAGLQRVKAALLEAEQRGRRMGMEEAIAIALDRSPDDDNLDWQVRQQVAAVIRAKLDEVQK